MKVTLFFLLEQFGLVKIETHTCHGSYDKLYVGGLDHTDDGPMIEKISQAIGEERYGNAMYLASCANGIHREMAVA